MEQRISVIGWKGVMLPGFTRLAGFSTLLVGSLIFAGCSGTPRLGCQDDATGRIRSPQKSQEFIFRGAVGEVVRLAVWADPPVVGFKPCLQVIDPTGEAVSRSCESAVQATLAVIGDYRVRVADQGQDGTGFYKLRLEPRSPTLGGKRSCAQKLACGASVKAQIDAPLSTNAYTFDARAGEAFAISTFDGGTNSRFQPCWQVLGPDGTPLGRSRCAERRQLVAPRNGLYTIVVYDDDTDAPGEYSLRVEPRSETFGGRQSCARSLSCGDDLSVRIENPTASETFRFSAVAGETVALSTFTMSNNSTFQPCWQVLDASGTALERARCSEERSVLLPKTGVFTVVVFDKGADAAGDFHLRVQPRSATFGGRKSCARTIACGNTLPAILAAPGAADSYAFDGKAGQTIKAGITDTSTNGGFDPCLQVLDPSGAVVGRRICEGERTVTLRKSGLHTIIVWDRRQKTADRYSLLLECR